MPVSFHHLQIENIPPPSLSTTLTNLLRFTRLTYSPTHSLTHPTRLLHAKVVFLAARTNLHLKNHLISTSTNHHPPIIAKANWSGRHHHITTSKSSPITTRPSSQRPTGRAGITISKLPHQNHGKYSLSRHRNHPTISLLR